jgi:thymidylate synthase
MGIRVHTRTYQDRLIADDPEMETLELNNYIYQVVEPRVRDLHPTQPWADAEFEERITSILAPTEEVVNPGEAWRLRSDVWGPFLQEDGSFAYTYNERLTENEQVAKILAALRRDKYSRQAFVSIWQSYDTDMLGGISRVPCSLGYLLQIRGDKLNLTYLQRSADFATHFTNDVYLAFRFQEWVAGQLRIEPGFFCHWVGSLHVFQKDVKNVF